MSEREAVHQLADPRLDCPRAEPLRLIERRGIALSPAGRSEICSGVCDGFARGPHVRGRVGQHFAHARAPGAAERCEYR
ncbi:hypothetical protein BSZ39_08125 [Bowdeniella nasicola]|uniref:Uncharacterized protein n=1 Tax=Bowdeniella nasicola TaxID=208480 RepID=A0A1Q5Q1J2_9ACTO|nr:hypothetical protein [Bowdeniella nasicola]OKL53687.1 hypothetical protein BSZ39_08125 [Bowdeniella nasicola]